MRMDLKTWAPKPLTRRRRAPKFKAPQCPECHAGQPTGLRAHSEDLVTEWQCVACGHIWPRRF